MTKTFNIASFVLRFTQELWQDMQGEPHVRWRGQIRHVQGDEEGRFTDFADAVAFMQHYLTQLTVDTLSGDEGVSQEKVFQESFKLWEKFASGYTEMMLQAMQQTIKQSEAFKEQLSEATEQSFKAWQFPGQANQSELVETLKELQQQVEALSGRVEDLENALQQQKKTKSESKKE